MRTNTVPSGYVSYPLRDLFGVVDEEQAVVHALEDFDVRMRTEGQEVLHLLFGDKGFFGAVGSSLCLPQHYIENHHQHEADSETDSGDIGVCALRGFGNQFFDDYVHHRPCSER